MLYCLPFSEACELFFTIRVYVALETQIMIINTDAECFLCRFNDAQVDALNMSPDFASKTTDAMVGKLPSSVRNGTTFNLDNFVAHNYTEHDASLSRQDKIQGSTKDVDPGLVRLMLADSPQPWLNAESIGRSRVRRENESQAIGSPSLSSDFVSFAQLEAAFIIVVFGVGGSESDVDMRVAPSEQVRQWFNEERFPIEAGYYRSQSPLTLDLQESIISTIGDWYKTFQGQKR
jgi:hypothetical protein